MELFRRVTAWGIREDTPFEEATYLRLTNVLLLFMLIGSVFETAACFAAGAYQAGLLNSTAPFLFGGGLLLMRSGRTLVARLLVLTIAYLAGYALATILGPEAQIQLLLLFASAISFTFFSLEQWPYILYGLALPIVCFVLLELTRYEPVFGFTRTSLPASALLLIRVSLVMIIWLLVVAQVAYHIRARRRTQEQLVSSAKMVALGQMASGIAHEVNNPLFLIVAHAERLENIATSGTVPAQQALEIAGKIQDIAMRIGAIVHGLQTLSRDASGDPFVELPLHSLVSLTLDYCNARIRSQQVELRIRQIPEKWTVIGREAQLSEVILNVLDNALDAVVHLDTRWIEIEAGETKESVEIKITDSGSGIASELRKKIFDPFFTTKPVGKGTGLGLSVSRGIMAAHGGKIAYDENFPGTRFVIRVPRGRDREVNAALTNGAQA
jgi:signal transduction histidine kinase